LVPIDGPKIGAVVPPLVQDNSSDVTTSASDNVLEANTQQEPLAITEAPKPPVDVKRDILPETPKAPDFDISDVIAIRLRAMRNLSANPNSEEAKMQLDEATKMVNNYYCRIFLYISVFQYYL